MRTKLADAQDGAAHVRRITLRDDDLVWQWSSMRARVVLALPDHRRLGARAHPCGHWDRLEAGGSTKRLSVGIRLAYATARDAIHRGRA
jgi:hypothetical protein